MDSTVIQEIANQLGMAVDQAGQFITDHLPEFAAMKSMQAMVGLSIAWAVTIVLIALALTFLMVTVKRRISDYELAKEASSYPMHNDYSDYATFFAFVCVGICAVCAFIAAIIITAIDLPDVIGWSNYPEAMLIDMELKAVG